MNQLNFLEEEAQKNFSHLPNQQDSQTFFQSSYNSLVAENALNDYTWFEQDMAFQQAVEHTGLPLEAYPGTQIEDNGVYCATDSKNLRASTSLDDRLAGLEYRLSGLEVAIYHMRNELEEKTRFFAELEAYIARLVAWTKDSKDAIDGLVADLKNAVALILK